MGIAILAMHKDGKGVEKVKCYEFEEIELLGWFLVKCEFAALCFPNSDELAYVLTTSKIAERFELKEKAKISMAGKTNHVGVVFEIDNPKKLYLSIKEMHIFAKRAQEKSLPEIEQGLRVITDALISKCNVVKEGKYYTYK